MKCNFTFIANDGKKFNEGYECLCYEFNSCIDWNKINELGIKIIICKEGFGNPTEIKVMQLDDVSLTNIRNESRTFYDYLENILESNYMEYKCLYVPNDDAAFFIKQCIAYNPTFDFDSVTKGFIEFDHLDKTIEFYRFDTDEFRIPCLTGFSESRIKDELMSFFVKE